MRKKQAITSGWRDAMRRHFTSAEFLAAGEAYDAAMAEGASTSYEDDLLRARILLKQDENRAVAFLIRRPPKGHPASQRGHWALLLAIGYARMRDFERADDYFELARRLLTSSADRAQLAYQLGRRAMLEGKTDEAWRFADEMLCDKSQATKITREMLRSFIFCINERYRESAQSLIEAIALIGKHRELYLEEWCHAVQNLALLGREVAFDEAAVLARSEVDQPIEWPADFTTLRFQALVAVGWSCALRGDMLGCFRYLRAAEHRIPSDPFEVILLLDRAHFARIVGEPNWALDEVAKAENIAERIDWNALAGEERMGLLLLARATAKIDAERGRYYLARYKGLDRIRSPLHLFAFDHRLEAYASYTEGVVRLAGRGTGAGAEESFRNAWVIFDRIGFDWRAARTALYLLQITNKDRWRHLAEDKLEPFPNSWLARELRNRDSAAVPPVKLPPMQGKVFAMLCQKMTTAEIATALGLSQHTVRNHLKAVFRAYGVNNRAALVAEAAGRRELPWDGR
jgi:DNA-binding CsgD family transcriptional regulator